LPGHRTDPCEDVDRDGFAGDRGPLEKGSSLLVERVETPPDRRLDLSRHRDRVGLVWIPLEAGIELIGLQQVLDDRLDEQGITAGTLVDGRQKRFGNVSAIEDPFDHAASPLSVER